MGSLVMAANMNNVGATTPNPMHSCKVCNKELENEKALWLHMRSHGIHHYCSNYHPSRNPQEPNMANCLVLLSNGTLKPLALVFTDSTSSKRSQDDKLGPSVLDLEPSIRAQDQSIELQGRGKFECKACNKVFTSHQALGGHRASHKKVKGCFAANVVASNLDVYENDENMSPVPDTSSPETRVSPPKKSNKIHECSICHKVFPSGQALGGHKRCHWLPYTLPPPLPPPPQTTIAPPQTLKFHNFFDVNESQPYNMGANKKPRHTIISSPPHQNATPTVTLLGATTQKAKTSGFFQSRHCSYKCNTTLSLFNDNEDLMPLKMQREGKSSSWLHLGFGSSTSSSEETA